MRDNTKFIVVAIYLANRAYGGPEEGGWWYNTAEPDVYSAWMTKIFKGDDMASAEAYVVDLEKVCDAMNRDERRKPPSSVLCDGWYMPIMTFDEYPHDMPKERPHYE